MGTKVSLNFLVSAKDPRKLLLVVSWDTASGLFFFFFFGPRCCRGQVEAFGKVIFNIFLKANYEAYRNNKLVSTGFIRLTST